MNFSDKTSNLWNDFDTNRNWYEVSNQLDWIWYLHCYAFASLYFALSSITLISVLRLRTSFATNPHFLFQNIFLLIFGVTRALYLYIDPYGSKNLFPILLSRIIWDIGFPCICSVLALLQLGFIHQMNEIKLNSSLISSESCVFITITMHFCFIIISDLLIVLQNSLKLIYISINIIFSIWIVFICTAFMMKSLQLLKTLSNLKSTDLSKNKSNTNVKTNKCNLQMKTLNTNHTKHEMKSENNLSKDVLTDENAAKPKIKITDENELTVSFASDNTPSQCNVTDSGHSSKSGSLKRNESNSIYRQSPKFNHKRNKYSNKMTRKNSNHSISHTESGLKNITETIDLREETDDKSCSLQYQIDICGQNQKISNCHVFENLVKRIIHLMAYGLFATLLQVIGVIGAEGLPAPQHYHIVLWFSYHSIYRITELLLVFTTISITSKSFHNYIYELRPNFKQRSLRVN